MNIFKKIQSRLKIRLISGFSTLLLIIAVAGCLFFTLQSISTGYVSFFGTSVFRVVTGSMEPEIPVGALLTSKQVEIEEIKENDIICFRSNEFGQGPKIITHRVIAIYTNPDGTIALQTKGDANPVVDATLVSEKQLIGLVTNYTGDGSKMAEIIQFLTSDFGFLACIILPVVLIAIWIFKDAIKNMKEAIAVANKQLDEQKGQNPESISEQEYTELYKKLEQELREEMQNNVQNDCGKVNSDAPQLDSEGKESASISEN